MTSLNFQETEGGRRPVSESLNRETFATTESGKIPMVGDYVCFDNEGEEDTVYKVKTRLFRYYYNDNSNTWSTGINIVVEKQSEDKFNMLIKM